MARLERQESHVVSVEGVRIPPVLLKKGSNRIAALEKHEISVLYMSFGMYLMHVFS